MSSDGLRIPDFYKLSVRERVRAVHERGVLTPDDFRSLSTGRHTLDLSSADRMVENVVGVMGLPLALGMNLVVNDKQYIVPMVVEEPSVVAGLSSACKLVKNSGGFRATSTDPILIGQIQIVDLPEIEAAKRAISERKYEIINLANSFHPNMVARGGGARDLELFVHRLPSRGKPMLVIHLLVDTRDAMGANLVNGMCEGVSPLIESITGGEVFLRIISNLTDRALVRASCTIPVNALAGRGYTGEQARDGIVVAADFAAVDPYRAATHNKGVMNGIDPLAIATGNDWRAIEAGAHAYACRSGRYTSLTDWRTDDEGNLCGSIEIPIKVGIVGAPLESNPTVALNLRLLSVESATELAEVMAAVGLAQNFAAIRALATEGIQKGHMTLHARSVVTAAGAAEDDFEEVLDRVVRSGVIKVWKAREIINELKRERRRTNGPHPKRSTDSELGVGFGKVVILGEHAVVYGRHAIGAPIPLTIKALIEDCDEGIHLMIPRWSVEYQLAANPKDRRSFERPAGVVLDKLGLTGRSMRIEVFPDVPRGMGLGGSAAMAVAIVRALDKHFELGLSDEDVNALAFESEKIAHGSPSGLDNTIASYGKPVVYRPGETPLVEPLNITEPIRAVIGMTGCEGLTAKTVRRVREAWLKDRKLYERIFDQIDALTLRGVQAIQDNDVELLGELMNVCHGMLNALQVSTPELEQLVETARHNGALGAKLTGGGGGGSIIAICDGDTEPVANAIRAAGFQAMPFNLGAEPNGS
ncbi:hydroxymethylglutaryl-CoA reductase, degradative [Candidatus Rariloculus sp.]|uniref:hydroxymethylglutaryl-CoA reductase, degradative n=1 Tax=Candidatus Rariloculus sp. TaxID=3101265 RepID=UPI003D0C02E9